MTIAIDRVARHVTLTMPGYIDKLLRKTKPEGIKGVSTPATYTPPNYKSAGAQRATTDTSAYVSESEKKYLQSAIGTLLYYSRAVDPTMCTAFHELGSIHAAPTQNDMAELDRLLQYAAAHKNNGIRYYPVRVGHDLPNDVRRLVPLQTTSSLSLRPSRIPRRRRMDQRADILRGQDDLVRGSLSRRSRAGGRFSSGTDRRPAPQHAAGCRLPPARNIPPHGQHRGIGH